jgi:hypothetical protein
MKIRNCCSCACSSNQIYRLLLTVGLVLKQIIKISSFCVKNCHFEILSSCIFFALVWEKYVCKLHYTSVIKDCGCVGRHLDK